MSLDTFTFDDFIQRAPRRPYCSDDLTQGLAIRPLSTASQKRYIQHNPPSHFATMIFDYDKTGVVLAADDAMLPPPSWVAESRETKRGHIAYALTVPVITSAAGHLAPVRFAAAIEQGYRDALRSDPCYTGHITKTPNHPQWTTHWGRADPYTLEELAEYLPVLPKLRKRSDEVAGLGRNVSLFENLRHWAYRVRTDFGDYDSWHAACLAHAQSFNGSFPQPLPSAEVRSTAKSVARWVWQRFTAAGFSAVQSKRGRRGGTASGACRTATALDRTARLLSWHG